MDYTDVPILQVRRQFERKQRVVVQVCRNVPLRHSIPDQLDGRFPVAGIVQNRMGTFLWRILRLLTK